MNKIALSLFLTASLLFAEDLQWIRESTLPVDEDAKLFLKELYTSTSSQGEEECCQRPGMSENTDIEMTAQEDFSSVQPQDPGMAQSVNPPIVPLTPKNEGRKGDRRQPKEAGGLKPNPQERHELCLVFASFSLPLESWKELSLFLEKTHGTFVLRGIPDNSFPLFSKKVQELRKAGVNASIEINPDAFEQYDIQAVPALVLVSHHKSDKITGNVSPEASLRMIEERGETSGFAKRLQGQMNPER